jgi:hypothetical protein
MKVPQVYPKLLFYLMKISLCTNARNPIYATYNQQIKFLNRLQIIRYIKKKLPISNSVCNLFDTGRNVNHFIKNCSPINSSELFLRKDLLSYNHILNTMSILVYTCRPILLIMLYVTIIFVYKSM